MKKRVLFLFSILLIIIIISSNFALSKEENLMKNGAVNNEHLRKINSEITQGELNVKKNGGITIERRFDKESSSYITIQEEIAKNLDEINFKKDKDQELIVLVFDLHQDTFANRSKTAPFLGIVIESRLDQNAGPKATVVIKNGTIKASLLKGDLKIEEFEIGSPSEDLHFIYTGNIKLGRRKLNFRK